METKPEQYHGQFAKAERCPDCDEDCFDLTNKQRFDCYYMGVPAWPLRFYCPFVFGMIDKENG